MKQRRKTRWTRDEDEYLADHWGSSPTPSIARKLGRSKTAVNVRAWRLGLGRKMEAGKTVPINFIAAEIFGKRNTGYTVDRWIRNGIPYKKARISERAFRVVTMDEFWNWLEQHKNMIDLSKLEPLALGPEPDWVREKRRYDIRDKQAVRKNHNDPWTDQDNQRLKRMIEKNCFSYRDIARELWRTESAVRRQAGTLHLGTAIRTKPRRWTKEETDDLIRMVDQGLSWAYIAEKLDRSALGVRGKYERLVNPYLSTREYRTMTPQQRKRVGKAGIHELSAGEIRENQIGASAAFTVTPPLKDKEVEA